jgi:hypothetical protein
MSGAGSLIAATALAAQPAANADSLKRRIVNVLANHYYWPDRDRSRSAVACQIRFPDFCASEHEYRPVTEYVRRRMGLVGPRSLAAWPDPTTTSAPELLAEIADSASDNSWYVGHLVYLSLTPGNLDESWRIAGRCVGNDSFCLALQGFVLHAYSRYAAADSTFSQSLTAMLPAEACKWRDIAPLLDSIARSRYVSLDCATRRAFEDSVWRLADPLYALEGNDRRTEHYSRRVMNVLLLGAPSPFATATQPWPWDTTLSDAMIRYGAAAHWIVPHEGVGDRAIHYHTPSYSFVPRSAEPTSEASGAPIFDLTRRLDAAEERYHPAYDYVTELARAQTIVLQRDDSLLVAAALDLLPFREAAPFAACMTLASVDGQGSVREAVEANGRALLSATIPRRATIMGVEVLSKPILFAGRLRLFLPSPSAADVSISQPLFFAPGNADLLPDSAADVFPSMLASNEIIVPTRLGVFWEIYGVPARTELIFSVRLTALDPPSSGILAKILSLFSSSATDERVVTWSQTAGGTYLSAHSLAFELADVRPGRYNIELHATALPGIDVSSHREIEIRKLRELSDSLVEAVQQPGPRVVVPVHRAPSNSPVIRDRRDSASDQPVFSC